MAEDKGMEPVDEGMAVVPDAPLADVPTIIPELEDVVSQLATDVSFARKTWKDGSEGATPITAAELNRLEKGVADLTNAVNALRDSVSRTVAMDDTVKASIVASSNQKGDLELRFTSKTGDKKQVTFFNSENNAHIVMWNSTKSKVEWSI